MTQFMEHRLTWLLICLTIFISFAIIEFGFSQTQVDMDLDENDLAYINAVNELRKEELQLHEIVPRMNELEDEYNPSDQAKQIASNVGGGFVNIFTIDIAGIPFILGLILTLINISALIISGIIIASFAYDIVKGLPFT